MVSVAVPGDFCNFVCAVLHYFSGRVEIYTAPVSRVSVCFAESKAFVVGFEVALLKQHCLVQSVYRWRFAKGRLLYVFDVFHCADRSFVVALDEIRAERGVGHGYDFDVVHKQIVVRVGKPVVAQPDVHIAHQYGVCGKGDKSAYYAFRCRNACVRNRAFDTSHVVCPQTEAEVVGSKIGSALDGQSDCIGFAWQNLCRVDRLCNRSKRNAAATRCHFKHDVVTVLDNACRSKVAFGYVVAVRPTFRNKSGKGFRRGNAYFA